MNRSNPTEADLTLKTETVYSMPTAVDLAGLLAGLSKPGPETLEALRTVGGRVDRLLYEANLGRCQRDVFESEGERRAIVERKTKSERRRDEIRLTLNRSSASGYPRLFLFGVAAAVGIAAEWALSRSILPSIFGVTEPWLSNIVSALPVAAMIAVEVALDRFMAALDEAYAQVTRLWLSVAACVVAALLGIGLIVANAHLILAVNHAREEAIRLATILTSSLLDTEIVVNQEVLNSAILAVGVVALLNVSVLLHVVLYDWRNLAAARKLRRELASAESEVDQSTQDLYEKDAEIASKRHFLNRVSELSQNLADVYRARLDFEILRMLDESKPSVEERIHESLVAPLARATAHTGSFRVQ
jgi:hypothetical protein